MRHGLCGDLGFSDADRKENIRRIGEVAKLFADAGLITLCSFVSPYRAARDQVRKLHEDAGLAFFEVFVDAPMEVCEERYPKGLYAKARRGEFSEFTGVSAPYEAPERPDIHLLTSRMTPEEAAREIVRKLRERGIVPEGPRT